MKESGKGMVNKYFDSSGNPRVLGTHGNPIELVLPRCGGRLLKASAAYPKVFGRMVCKLHLKHKAGCLA